MMTIQQALQGQKIAALDARLLLQHVTGLTHAEIIADPARELTAQENTQFEAFVARRASHEPIAYIIGSKEFWGLEFAVTPATLIPRPDSETLIELVLAYKQIRNTPLKIMDLGTGSGCLLLSLLTEYTASSGLGVDLSAAALEVARSNAHTLKLANRASFMLGDWAEALTGAYDIIVCNPPYIAESEWESIPADVANYEPGSALLGGQDGLDCYRKVMAQLPGILAQDGVAVFEIGHRQAAQVSAIAGEHGLRAAEVKQDLAGLDRAVLVTR